MHELPSIAHAENINVQDEAEASEGEEASTDEDYDEDGEDLDDGAQLCHCWCQHQPRWPGCLCRQCCPCSLLHLALCNAKRASCTMELLSFTCSRQSGLAVCAQTRRTCWRRCWQAPRQSSDV